MPHHVSERPEREVNLEATPVAEGEPRPLIVGLKPDGTRSSVFVVPGQYGEAFQFKRLAQRLRDDIPFYSFEARGLWGDVSPHTKMQEAARDYITEMRNVQPSGPYFLGGFSSGGQIAWEMAHQLQDADQTVHLLLFDIGPETLDRREMRKAQRNPWRIVTHPLRVSTFHVRNAVGFAGLRRKAYLRTLLRQEVRRFYRAVGLGPRALPVPDDAQRWTQATARAHGSPGCGARSAGGLGVGTLQGARHAITGGDPGTGDQAQ